MKTRTIHFLKQYRLILSCLALSVMAWFVMTIFKDYTQKYRFNLVFVDSTEQQKIVSQSDSLLVIEISERGISLLHFELMSNTIKVDCRQLLPNKLYLPSNMNVNQKQLRKYLIENYDFSEKFRLISPSSVKLKIE